MALKNVMVCAAVATVCLCSQHNAYAEDSGNNIFTFSGFGSVGVVHSNYSDADFKVDDTVPTGAGRSHSWAVTQMSRLGMQVNGQFTPQLSATAQVVAEYNDKGNYSPDLALASVKYQISPSMALQGGRFVLPMYMLTEYSRVGYALPWARPPLEMYRSFPSIDGLELTKKFDLGSTALTTAIYGGRSSHDATEEPGTQTETFTFSPLIGINATADVGASTFRMAYIQTRTDMSGSQFDSALDQYRAMGLSALVDQYKPTGRKISYTTLGYAYDPGDWFLRGEIAKVSRVDNSSLLPTFTDWYVTAGYRFGKFTPYMIYGREKDNTTTSIGAADPIGDINSALAAEDASRHSVSVGVRWDFHDSMDLKLQLTRTTRDTSTSNGGLSYISSVSSLPHSYNAVFAGYDFLF